MKFKVVQQSVRRGDDLKYKIDEEIVAEFEDPYFETEFLSSLKGDSVYTYYVKEEHTRTSSGWISP